MYWKSKPKQHVKPFNFDKTMLAHRNFDKKKKHMVKQHTTTLSGGTKQRTIEQRTSETLNKTDHRDSKR